MRTLDELRDILRSHGRKATPQRLLLFQAIEAHGQHASADEIYLRVRSQIPTLSLTTVYNTLHELVELGQVRTVDLGDGTTRYDPTTEPHAHLVCRRCRRTLDLAATSYSLTLSPAEHFGFTELDYELVVSGLCPDCQHI